MPSQGLLREVYRAKSAGGPTLYLIEDAHTNEQTQKNIAGMLETLLKQHGVGQVFLEGGSGDDGLNDLAKNVPTAHKQQVADDYLRRGLLGGAEYLNLLSERPQSLWGVEDRALYRKSIDVYRRLMRQRPRMRAYLDRIDVTAESFKDRFLNPALLAFDRKRCAYERGDSAVTEYFGYLAAMAGAMGMDPKRYANLAALEAIRKLERRIDFAKANLQQKDLLTKLAAQDASELVWQEPAGTSKVTSALSPKAAAFYARMSQQGHLAGYDQLSLYQEYLRAAAALGAADVLSERASVERFVEAALVSDPDQARLLEVCRQTALLKKLIELNVTADDMPDDRLLPEDLFSTLAMTGFLNRKIMEFGGPYERALFAERDAARVFGWAKRFYELTRLRDERLVASALERMHSLGLKKAALVAGGYHSPNLRAIFKKQEISFVCLRPQATQETNRKRYEKLLLGQQIDGKAAEPAAIALLPMRESAYLGVFNSDLMKWDGTQEAIGKQQEVRETIPVSVRLEKKSGRTGSEAPTLVTAAGRMARGASVVDRGPLDSATFEGL
ncbi:MAG: hypothetical protein WCG06_03310, partial [Candidatus Omnitrophota bacterium]